MSQVYLPAIVGYVPKEMVMCLSAFLDACYIAHCQDIGNNTLNDFEAALGRFWELHKVFHTLGVRPTGFSLPRQHSLVHYHHLVEDFSAPSGLCSSITESHHIMAVKKPWHHSNHFNAIGQMLQTNQCLNKISATCSKFVELSMLPAGHTPSRYTSRTHVPNQSEPGRDNSDGKDESPVDGNLVMGHVILAWKHGKSHCQAEQSLSDAEQHASTPGISTVLPYT